MRRVPTEFANQFTSTGGAETFNDLTSVGDLGTAVLAGVPEQFRATVEPVIPAIVDGFGTWATFVVGIATAL